MKEKPIPMKLEKSLLKAEKEIKAMSKELNGSDLSGLGNVHFKASKPISQIKKGDKIRVDSRILEVDSHYVLIDHGNTKEMAIELFDPKTDKDYQLRYFSDNIENSLQFFELDEIVYNQVEIKKIEW